MNGRRGVTLIELLLTLMLLGVFGVVAMRLVHTTLGTLASTGRADDAMARFDRAVLVLRADLSTATSTEWPAADVLLVHASGGDVRWGGDAKLNVVRTARGRAQSWDVGAPVTLRQDGAIVLLRVAGSTPSEVAVVPGRDVLGRGK